MAKYSRGELEEKLLYPYPLRQTDVGVAFGARGFSAEIAEATAGLYHRGAYGKVVVTGGAKVLDPYIIAGLAITGRFSKIRKDFFGSATEAGYITHLLCKEFDVPSEDIIRVDCKSKNTGQNIARIAGALSGFQSATFVSWFASTERTLATARKDETLGSLTIVPAHVYPFGIQSDQIFKSRLLTALYGGTLQHEARKLDPAASGNYINTSGEEFCAEVDRGAEVTRIKALPPLPR